MIKSHLDRCTALTGGIATGKSTVATMMRKLGANIIDTDLIAREVVEPGKPALSAIISQFGKQLLQQDGTLDRDSLREEIIRDPAKREILNSLTHPEINKEVIRLIDHYAVADNVMPIIIDVPLLFEAGWHRLFPRVVLVYVPREVQIERLMSRDGLDRDTAVLTLAAQMCIDDKKAMSTFIIDNSGTLAETRQQVDIVFRKIS